MPERTDHNEAMRLADELAEEAERRVCHVAMAPASLLKDAAALLRQQAEQIDQLRAEVERLRVGAERYEWLRENSYVEVTCNSPRDPSWTPQHLDAAIDHARTTHKETE